jgi:putative ABC transport system substrate-binding protein
MTRFAHRIHCNNSGLLVPVCLLAICLQLSAFNALADSYLLVKSGNGDIYNRFEKSLSNAITSKESQNKLTSIDIATFESEPNTLAMAHFTAIISAGIEASMAVSKLHIDATTFMAMLPRESYIELSATGDIACEIKNCRALFLDQPIIRQLHFLKLVLPSAKRITILSSRKSQEELNKVINAASDFNFSIHGVRISNEESVFTALKQDLDNSDVLMTMPDPVVYNRNTARAILLSAFYKNLPVFAYSQSFVHAGATFGIYSTPEDIARHLSELLASPAIKPSSVNWLYPKYYTIDVNRRAADALGISMPASKLLEERLKTYDKN